MATIDLFNKEVAALLADAERDIALKVLTRMIDADTTLADLAVLVQSGVSLPLGSIKVVDLMCGKPILAQEKAPKKRGRPKGWKKTPPPQNESTEKETPQGGASGPEELAQDESDQEENLGPSELQRKIIETLAAGPLSAEDLAKRLKISQAAVKLAADQIVTQKVIGFGVNSEKYFAKNVTLKPSY